MSLVQAFLSPDQVENAGIDGLIAGSTQVQHQAIDVDVVNALRNQLVGRPLDLAALNIFRGRDMGIAPFNSVRAQLYEKTGLEQPEALRRLGRLRSSAMAFPTAAARPSCSKPIREGFETMDLWVGGLLEKPAAGQLGSTFGYIFLEQLDRLQHGDRFYYLEIFDDSLFTEDNDVTFAQIIERNTGLTGLPENVFDLDGSNAPADDDDSIFNPDPDQEDDDSNVGNDDEQDDDDETGDDDSGGDDVEEDDEDDDVGDDDDDTGGDDEDDDATVPPPPATHLPHVVYLGTPADDVYVGTAGNDFLGGGAGDDSLFGFDGDDTLTGGSGDDTLVGDAGNDLLLGDAGRDRILAGAGDDRVFGGAGRDTIFGDDGDDVIFGDGGDDAIEGGNGNDTFFASVGDGNDTYGGGAGIDTLDMTAIMANLDANLLTGVVSSVQSGTDGVTGVEIFKGGAGDDTITIGFGATVVDGGAGNDTFVFASADAANVTIEGFSPGDKIDLRPLFQTLQLGGGGDDFTLIPSGDFSAAGQIKIETVDNDTFVRGNTDDNPDNDFSIKIANRPFSASDFT